MWYFLAHKVIRTSKWKWVDPCVSVCDRSVILCLAMITRLSSFASSSHCPQTSGSKRVASKPKQTKHCWSDADDIIMRNTTLIFWLDFLDQTVSYPDLVTSGEVYTGSLKHLAEPNSLGKTKLELIGKQTKLLSPNQPRLLTPALTQMGAQFVPSSMASREKAFGQRTRMTIAGAKKHEWV